jgi:purine-nucleoside phosphorylase
MSTFDDLTKAASFVATKTAAKPLVGVVLGSGLGMWADSLESRDVIPYAEIPSMPQSNVVGHAGNLVLGRSGDVPVACLQGRVHLYEGHELDRVVFGARLLARLGCKAVLLTNAAGGIRRGFQPGDLMLITDHLNLTARSPLAGPNDDRLGPRFPDMTDAYSLELRRLAVDAARSARARVHEGVYAALLGPSYETPAEIQMLRVLGADAVGMSTVPEVIALRHMGVLAGAMSCITNLAAGLSGQKLDHAEVEATAKAARDSFVGFLSEWVRLTGAHVTGARG